MANQSYDKDLERAFAAAAADARVRRAMDEVRGRIAETTEAQKELALIEAPTGHERARAERYRDMLAAAGLEDVAMDGRFNVRGRIRGRGATGKCVLLEGHLDTVFRFGDVKGVTVDEAGRIHCPGICDDARALAANLAVVRAIRAAGLAPWHDVVVAGTVREEGLGGMQGMQWLLDDLQREYEVLASISIDGAGGDVFYASATGMVDYDVVYTGPGGHAWTAYGLPSALHAAARAVALAADLELPAEPKTAFTASLIEGGQAIHGIAQRASFKVNARSDGAAELADMDRRLREIFRRGAELENARWGSGLIKAEVSVILETPAGSQDSACRMVQAAELATRAVGLEPALKPGGCTNGNMAIARGIPAVTLGRGGREHGQHTLEEWFDPEGVWVCEQKSLLMLAVLAGMVEGAAPLAETLRPGGGAPSASARST